MTPKVLLSGYVGPISPSQCYQKHGKHRQLKIAERPHDNKNDVILSATESRSHLCPIEEVTEELTQDS